MKKYLVAGGITVFLSIAIGLFAAWNLGLIGKGQQLYGTDSGAPPAPLSGSSTSRLPDRFATSSPLLAPQPGATIGKYNIGLRTGVSSAEGESIITKVGGKVIRAIPTLSIISAQLTGDQALSLLKNSKIEWVEKNQQSKFQSFSPLTSSVSFFPVAYAQTSSDINLYILDTGAGAGLPYASTANVVSGVDPTDTVGHGTEVAHSAFAAITARGAHVAVSSIKITVGTSTTAEADDIAAGVQEAVDLGANVINLSFSCSQSDDPALCDAVSQTYNRVYDYAHSHNVSIVFAAGNVPGYLDVYQGYPGLISAGGLTGDGCVDTELSGDTLSTAADFYASSYSPGGLHGTSFASPRIAAHAAIVMGEPLGSYDTNGNGIWDIGEIENRLHDESKTDLSLVDGRTLFGNGGCVAPIAKLALSATSGTAPFLVTADAAGSRAGTGNAAISSYKVDWGTGDISIGTSSQKYSYRYSAAGAYTIKLTVADAVGGLSNDNTILTINAAPTVVPTPTTPVSKPGVPPTLPIVSSPTYVLPPVVTPNPSYAPSTYIPETSKSSSDSSFSQTDLNAVQTALESSVTTLTAPNQTSPGSSGYVAPTTYSMSPSVPIPTASGGVLPTGAGPTFPTKPLVPAAGTGGPNASDYNLCDLRVLANNIISFAVVLSVFVATLMFAYGGILYITGPAGGEAQIKKAHAVLLNAVVGIFIVLLAWLIINIVLSVLTGNGVEFWTTLGSTNVCDKNPVGTAFPAAPNIATFPAQQPNGVVGGPNVTAANGLNISKEASSIDANATGYTGACAAHVRAALQAGGAVYTQANGCLGYFDSSHPNELRNPNAYQYGPCLQGLGFQQVSSAGYVPQAGDVVVFPQAPNQSTPQYGHIALYDGTQWVSDALQGNSMSPGSKYNGVTPTIYRPGG